MADARQQPAPPTGAATLLQWAAGANEPLATSIAMSLYDVDSILNEIPLVTRKSMNAVGARFTGKNAPATNVRRINQTPVATSGIPERYREAAFILANEIVTDHFIQEDMNSIGDYQAQQIKYWLEMQVYEFNDRFINNKHDGAADNDDWMVGIKARIDNGATGDGTYGVNKGMKYDAGGVDISPAGVTKTTANNFFIVLDRLLANMGSKDGTGCVLMMNEWALSYGASALRTLGAGAGWSTDTDAYDRPFLKYKNAKVMDIGRKKDQAYPIISAAETAGGIDGTYGSDQFTSIYAVRLGSEYLSGWQFDKLVPKNYGLVSPPGTYYLVVFDWAMGLLMQNSRSISRAFNIKIGTTPAPAV